MDDKHLSATLKAHGEKWHKWRLGPESESGSGKEPVLSAQAKAALEKLRVEAGRVRDPGGPIGDYGTVLYDWAIGNHPDIDDGEMFHHVFNKLLFDAR